MKPAELNDAIYSCFDPSHKDYIDLIYFGKENGKEVAICKGIHEVFLINLNKREIIATQEIIITTHISQKFDTFAEASKFVMSQDRYVGLEITDFCSKTGEYGFFVNMDVLLELSDRQIVKKLLNKIQQTSSQQ